MEISGTKKEARKLMLSKLSALSSTEIMNKSLSITDRVARLPAWRECRYLLSFLSMEKEVDTASIHDMAEQEGKVIAVPRIAGNDLIFHRITTAGLTGLKPNVLGIKEPNPEDPVISPGQSPESKFLILVPGLAFDENRNRLGRGKGFYDRYISEMRRFSVINYILAGVFFENQLLMDLPFSAHDQVLDYIITNARIIQ